MTIERLSPKTLELRYFVDALRGAIGLAPLYHVGQPRTELERFGGSETELPFGRGQQEWFRPVAFAPDDRERDKSVMLQIKKRSGNMQFSRKAY